jgi:hypothetical protein
VVKAERMKNYSELYYSIEDMLNESDHGDLDDTLNRLLENERVQAKNDFLSRYSESDPDWAWNWLVDRCKLANENQSKIEQWQVQVEGVIMHHKDFEWFNECLGKLPFVQVNQARHEYLRLFDIDHPVPANSYLRELVETVEAVTVMTTQKIRLQAQW